MHHQNKTFAITELIERVKSRAGVDDVEFVKALGYRNIHKGRRRLDSWRDTGSGDADFLKRLSLQFGISTSTLEETLIRTITQLSNKVS